MMNAELPLVNEYHLGSPCPYSVTLPDVASMNSDSAESPALSAPSSEPPQSSPKRHWPFLLFCCSCFVAYFYWDGIVRNIRLAQPVVVGFVLGTLAVAFLIAGFLGRSRAVSLFVATAFSIACLLIAFVAIAEIWVRGKFEFEILIYEAQYLLYIPLLMFCASVPLTPILQFFRYQLTRGSVQPKLRVTLETYLLWTVILACVVLCAQLSIQLNHYTWQQLLQFLPGQIVLVVALSAVLVLPTAYWPFVNRQRWWHWPATAFVALIGFFVVGTVVNLTIRQWLGTRIPGGTSMFILSAVACAVYLPGLWSLRACGYRWKPLTATSDDNESRRAASKDRVHARVATVCYLVMAILASCTLHYADYLQQRKFDTVLAIRKEFSDRGEAIKAGQNQVTGLQLTSLKRDRFSEPLLDRLSVVYELVLKNSDIVDEDLKLLSLAPNIYSLDLSHTAVTDEALKHLEPLINLQFLKVSGTKITPTALSDFLDTHLSLQSLQSLTIEDMQLTDEQFQVIYKPWIKEWRLAGNQLTDAGVSTLMNNDTAISVDLSRNPISRNAFSLTTRLNRMTIQADQSPLDDVTVAKLINSGLLGELILGRSSVTPTGLNYALDMGISVKLLPGSFTEPELETIDPQSGHLEISGMKTSGGFLKYWKKGPQSLRTSNTLLNDEALLSWSERRRSAPLQILGLQGSKVTDACIPALIALQPKQLDVRGSQITAAGLQKLNLPDTVLIVEHGQYSNAEIQALKKRFSKLYLQCEDY